MTKVTELRAGYQDLIMQVEKHKMIIAAQSTLINKMSQTAKDLSNVMLKQTVINKDSLVCFSELEARIKLLEVKSG